MEAQETAQAIYEDETQGEQSARELADDLRRRAAELREREAAEACTAISDDVREQTADLLVNAADALETSLGQYNPTMKQIGGGVAGRAKLDSSWMEIDPHAIGGDGAQLIDTSAARAICSHERRHQQQKFGDASSIQAKGEVLQDTELYEWDAMESEEGSIQHTAEYEGIRAKVSRVLNAGDRELVRQGKFRELEERKNLTPILVP